MIKYCVICGAAYNAPPSDKRTTCGASMCVTENKRRTHISKHNRWTDASRAALSARGLTNNLKKGTPAARQSPKSGRFETNCAAKRWVLQSPDGNIYDVRNLKLWSRSHCRLFGKPDTEQSAAQIAAGFRQVKRIMQGKCQNRAAAYMGWRILEWED